MGLGVARDVASAKARLNEINSSMTLSFSQRVESVSFPTKDHLNCHSKKIKYSFAEIKCELERDCMRGPLVPDRRGGG